MIRNYIKVAIRNLFKYKFISFINLFGLTVGLSCCLLIMVYILHEVSYDKFQPDADRSYRVTRTFINQKTGAPSLYLSTVAPPFGPLLQNDFKEIESMSRFISNGTTPVKYNEKIFNEPNVYFADDKLFDFFKVEMVTGNKRLALTDPFSVLLTDEMAKKYFGTEDPVNKFIKINPGGNYFNFKVAGIYKPFPSNTHFHPDVLMSFNTLKDTAVYGAQNLQTSFGNNSFFTFIRLPKGYDPKRLENQFPSFLDRRMAGQYQGTTKASSSTSLGLQKITDIHLRSHTDYEAEENGDIKRVYVFSAIALFLLLIACINYMNLSTARSILRAKEIGIRKVAGALKKEIMLQFLCESILISWIALILAFGITLLLLPALNKVSGQQLDITALLQWQVLGPICVAPFLIGILSGIYPAVFMSSFQPVKVLKGFLKSGGGISFRKVLVTFQFAISIILIICTAVVFNQMRFMENKALGFDKDHIVIVPYVSELNDRFEAFRTDLMFNSDIKNVGRSSRIPTGRLLDAQDAKMSSGDTLAPVQADIKFVSADRDFIPTYGIKIIAGRGFSRDYGTDTSSFLINEAAVQVLGFKNNEDVLGRNFSYGDQKGKLIGVFHDFHFESMHQKIVPLVLLMPKNANFFNNITVKAAGTNMPATIAYIERTWKKFLPEVPFQYNFLDDKFTKLYEAEQKQRTLFTIFSCLAIFIACLGLFGLSAFTISQRIREIGIRKVLGAEVSSIVVLLSADFLKLVGIASVIAFPIAAFAMYRWLLDFAYRITLPWWIFILAAIIAAIIALVTISFQAVKAALANPVKSLRSE